MLRRKPPLVIGVLCGVGIWVQVQTSPNQYQRAHLSNFSFSLAASAAARSPRRRACLASNASFFDASFAAVPVFDLERLLSSVDTYARAECAGEMRI